MEVLNRHIPLKKNVLRPNHSSDISKTLRKATIRNVLEKNIFKNTDNTNNKIPKS